MIGAGWALLASGGGGGAPPLSLLGVGSADTSLLMAPPVANGTAGTVFVDASIPASGDGLSLATAKKTIPEGLAILASGGTMRVKGGTYVLPAGGLVRSTAWASRTTIAAYGDDRPVLDASGVGANASAINMQAGSARESWHRFHVVNVPSKGGGFDGQAVRAAGATQPRFSDMWVSHCANDGIWFFGCTSPWAIDCRVWRLGDGVTVSTDAPDGIVCTGNPGSPTTNPTVARNFVANAPDDGIDLFRAINGKVLSNVVYDCGRYWNGNVGGDGNGLKLGGDNDGNDNAGEGNLALACRNNGIDGNQGDSIVYQRNTAVDCGGLGFDCNGDLAAQDGLVADCIALGNAGGERYVGAFVTQVTNTWNLGITDADFGDPLAFDYSLLPGSPCIGAGGGGGNLGASEVALLIAKDWCARDLT